MQPIALVVSDIMPLATGVEAGQRLCVIGDVHGMSNHMRRLLDWFRETMRADTRSTLLLTGDLIDRGPDSLGALDLAAGSSELGFAEVVPLMGNHEQLLRMVLRGRDDLSPELWIQNRGTTVLAELEFDIARVVEDVCVRGDPGAIAAFVRELSTRLGARRTTFLENLEHHRFAGNLLFVHAGINHRIPLEDHLGQPWDLLDDLHWAWIRESFLFEPVADPAMTVVHGHTPVSYGRRRITDPGLLDPHLCRGGKINLDGGSVMSRCVAGAEFTPDGYRLLLAVEK